jgi:hypothetical protein
MYEAKIKGGKGNSNVNMQGQKKATVSAEHKFYGKITSDGVENPFNKLAPNGVKIAGYTERDYGNVKAVYHDKGTSKVFGKGH